MSKGNFMRKVKDVKKARDDSIIVRRLFQFSKVMNPNFSSTTLYHGMVDILHGRKPLFYLDNKIEFDDVKEERSK